MLGICLEFVNWTWNCGAWHQSTLAYCAYNSITTLVSVYSSTIMQQSLCQHVRSSAWCHLLCHVAEFPQKWPQSLYAFSIGQPKSFNSSRWIRYLHQDKINIFWIIITLDTQLHRMKKWTNTNMKPKAMINQIMLGLKVLPQLYLNQICPHINLKFLIIWGSKTKQVTWLFKTFTTKT